MTDAPLCGCHGEPMRWIVRQETKYQNGGHWACSVKYRAAHARYNKSEKGHARGHQYDQSAKGRERRRLHDATLHRILSKQIYELARARVRY
jgi:hypothetical protein